jgi:enamine deaminase RidA (YjgF/YER057c/UK114 family)
MRYGLFAMLAVVAFAGKNPDETQTLQLPQDPPMVATGETGRLVFHKSPLSAKGLLSQQTRDALKAILKANGGSQVIHLRAFVAGSGDLRRVPQIVSEVFTAKKMPLPSVSVVLVGRLPLENAQVAIEAVSVGKKEVNPDGLTFAEASQLSGAVPLQVTCFVSSIDNEGTLEARFPSAPVTVVQTQRAPGRAGEICEAVGRGGAVKAPRLAFTGTQVAFGVDEKAAALAFQRLDRELNTAGGEVSDIIQTNVYSLSERIGELARKIRTTPGPIFPGPIFVVPSEGVASLDGTFAVDAIAAVRK